MSKRQPEPHTRPPVAVLKYPIPIDDHWHEVPYMRTGDSMVPWHIGMQDGVVMVWCVPAPGTPAMDQLKVVGTGYPFNAENRYIGTVQDPRGLVWHVIAGGHDL